jgi:hypothetical protein
MRILTAFVLIQIEQVRRYLRNNSRRIGFWLVWVPAAPLVWLYFAFSDLAARRWYHPRAGTQTGLVRRQVWDRFVLRKSEFYRERNQKRKF